MKSITSINAHVAELKAGCDARLSWSEFDSAMSAWYGGVYEILEDVVVAELHCAIRLGIVYEDGTRKPVVGTAPAGLDYLPSLFTTGDDIVDCSVERFNSYTTVRTVTDSDTQETTTVVENTLLDTWTSNYSSSTITTQLTAIMTWCHAQGINSSIRTLLAPKQVIEVPSRRELYDLVYVERGVQDVIEAIDSDILIPDFDGDTSNDWDFGRVTGTIYEVLDLGFVCDTAPRKERIDMGGV